jgi:sulfate/thiosulfate-binding protein
MRNAQRARHAQSGHRYRLRGEQRPKRLAPRVVSNIIDNMKSEHGPPAVATASSPNRAPSGRVARTLSKRRLGASLLLASALLLTAGCTKGASSGSGAAPNEISLLNVSYDPTRELYGEFNVAFAAHWKTKTGSVVVVNQSHGGSSKQARAVIDGLGADVVTLAMAADVDAIADRAGLIPAAWQSRLPNNSSPYTSTIIFAVRKGNPKQIHDWDDVVRPGIVVVPGNPKTSGGARWTYLAAYGYARAKFGTDDRARDFVRRLYQNAPVLDSGARGTTTTFAERGVGDVLLNWENDILLLRKEQGDKVEVIYPSVSVLAETTVAVVDKNAAQHGTTEVAREYLGYLFSEQGQEIAAKHYFRPSSEAVARRYSSTFPELRRFTVDQTFGGWSEAQAKHFADNGVFDQIYVASK